MKTYRTRNRRGLRPLGLGGWGGPTGGAGTCVNLPEHGWEDRALSAINTGPYTASLFFNEDCVGGPYPIGPGEWASPLNFTPKSVWVY